MNDLRIKNLVVEKINKIRAYAQQGNILTGLHNNSYSQKVYNLAIGLNSVNCETIESEILRVLNKNWRFVNYQLTQHLSRYNDNTIVNNEINKLKLVATDESRDIDLCKYSHNISLGLEIEGEFKNQRATIRSIAEHFGLKEGKTNGKGESKTTININGSEITIPLFSDLYKNPNIVTQVYGDGSLNNGVEVVTRQLLITQLKTQLKPIWDYLQGFIDSNRSSCGLHFTFLLDKHKELSNWDRLVVKNLIQLVRYYYKELVFIFKQSDRGTRYRILPTLDEQQTLNTSHYTAVSLRKDRNTIWGIEIRITDGLNDFNKLIPIVKFYMALIRHSARISQKGLIYISQERIDEQKEFYHNNGNRTGLRIDDNTREGINELMIRLKKDLTYFNFDDEDLDSINGLYEFETQRTTQ